MIDVLVMLARNPKIDLIFAGGQINKSRDGFWDSLNLEFMSNFHPSLSFIGAVGIDVEKNFASTNDSNTGMHKRRMIDLSKNVYIIAESRKFGTQANFNFTTLQKIRGLVTETAPPKKILDAAKKMQVEIILPD